MNDTDIKPEWVFLHCWQNHTAHCWQPHRESRPLSVYISEISLRVWRLTGARMRVCVGACASCTKWGYVRRCAIYVNANCLFVHELAKYTRLMRQRGARVWCWSWVLCVYRCFGWMFDLFVWWARVKVVAGGNRRDLILLHIHTHVRNVGECAI